MPVYALILEPDQQLTASIRQLWHQLAAKQLSTYHVEPPKDPHITLLAFEETRPFVELKSSIQQIVHDYCRFPLTLVGPSQFPSNGAIFYRPSDAESILTLRKAFLTSGLFPQPNEAYDYVPHLTIANYVTPIQAAAICTFASQSVDRLQLSGHLEALVLLQFSRSQLPVPVARWELKKPTS